MPPGCEREGNIRPTMFAGLKRKVKQGCQHHRRQLNGYGFTQSKVSPSGRASSTVRARSRINAHVAQCGDTKANSLALNVVGRRVHGNEGAR